MSLQKSGLLPPLTVRLTSVPSPMIRRTVFHPGPIAARRFTAHVAEVTDYFRLWLAPGKSLFDAILDLFTERGFNHATLHLYDGDLAKAAYMVAPPDPSGELVVAYSDPQELAGGARLITANADLGRKANGQPILHCHGALRDGKGRLHGGHIPTDICIIGDGGVRGWAVVPHDEGFVVKNDDETRFPVLSP